MRRVNALNSQGKMPVSPDEVEVSVKFRARRALESKPVRDFHNTDDPALDVPNLCAFSTIEERFLPFGRLGDATTFRDGRFWFRNRAAKRSVHFANYLLKNNLKGTFVFNLCDAADFDYSRVRALKGVPIFQFARQAWQRKRVVLVPLPDRFMSPGSRQIPDPGFDSRQFSEKRPSLVWRGRMSGVLTAKGCGRTWMKADAQAVFKGRAELLDRLLSYPRSRMVLALSRYNECNVGFVEEEWERSGHGLYAKDQDRISPIMRGRMSIQQQLEHRYLLALEGNDFATSLFWGLASNSVVMSPPPIWETALHEGLNEWEHYVPIDPSGSDVTEKIDYCESNYGKMLEIIEAANLHVRRMKRQPFRDVVDFEVFRAYLSQVEVAGDFPISLYSAKHASRLVDG